MSRIPPERLLTARAFAEDTGADAAQRLARFLREYWGRAALALPGVLGDFEVPLDADELAGLACEPDADARIVRRESDRLVLEQGPFEPERFDSLGDADWSLLVNAVDLTLPGFEPLLEAVRFVPDWRLDDIMVSFAAPGGSVGPHFDHYDVFLLQAQGTRRWELGGRIDGDARPRSHAGGLDLVTGFRPDEVVRCGPGDGLYVPPGLVHHGIAETPCLTLSLGFRSPGLPELVSDWVLAAADDLPAHPLDLDPELPADPALLDDRTLERARATLRAQLLETLDGQDDAAFAGWLGELLSRSGRHARFDASDSITPEALAAELEAGAALERAPGLRLLLRPAAGGTLVFAGGERFPCPLPPEALAPFTRLGALYRSDLREPAALELAAALFDAGRMILVDPDGA